RAPDSAFSTQSTNRIAAISTAARLMAVHFNHLIAVLRVYRAARSQVGPDHQVNAPGRIEVGDHWARHIESQKTDGRLPAQPQAGAGVGLEARLERIACIHEGRQSPILQEVVLVLDAADGEVLAADDPALSVGLADLLVIEAADGAVAACEEA